MLQGSTSPSYTWHWPSGASLEYMLLPSSPCRGAEQIISATVSRILQLFLKEPANKRISSYEDFWYSASWFSAQVATVPMVWSPTSTAPAWVAQGLTVMQMYSRAPSLKVEAASTLLTHRPSILTESRNFGSSSKTSVWAPVSPSMCETSGLKVIQWIWTWGQENGTLPDQSPRPNSSKRLSKAIYTEMCTRRPTQS